MSAIDILMDPVTLDLPDFTRHQAGLSVIAQRVRARLETFLGSWPLERSVGMDWLGILTSKPFDEDGFLTTLAVEMAATPGVLAVESIELTRDGQAVEVRAMLRVESGEILTVVVSPTGLEGNPSIAIVFRDSRSVVYP
jgi:hypothetical protein